MRRLGIAAVTAVAVAAAPAAVGVAQEMGGHRHLITIKHLRFTPAELVVASGDTVMWVNRDLVPHTVTARDQSWDSQELAENATWEMRVTDATAREYFCRYHPAMYGRLAISRNRAPIAAAPVEIGESNHEAHDR